MKQTEKKQNAGEIDDDEYGGITTAIKAIKCEGNKKNRKIILIKIGKWRAQLANRNQNRTMEKG
jgi:hypothetical protein